MKTAIVYYSQHHGNTRKLVEGIAAAAKDVTLIDVTKDGDQDLSAYDMIGIASGIYAGNYANQVRDYILKNLPQNKKVFLLHTSAMNLNLVTNTIRKILGDKHADIRGTYACLGYNTFGPFKIVGGTAKGRPNEEDVAGAVKFFKSL